MPPAAGSEALPLPLPPPLLASSTSHAATSLIIDSYTPGLGEPRAPEARTHPLTATAPFINVLEGGPGPGRQPSHDRHDSQSSAVSLASSSTLTSAYSHQQRFVRYVMSTHADAAGSLGRWSMDNVLAWLDGHGFSDSWKETFRRNEISGNRFLELGNYAAASAVWRQLSLPLGAHGDPATVDRFIGLLGAETHMLAAAPPPLAPSLLDIDLLAKLENRKSSSTLWAQGSPSVPTKQRPFSYVDPGNCKPAKEHTKFFRKHTRLLSNENALGAPAPLTGGKPASEASLGLSNLGFKKSGILSTLRKYGGEKAAGIVKQPDDQRLDSPGSLCTFRDNTAKSPSSVRSFNVPHFDESAGAPVSASSKSASRPLLEDVVSSEFLPQPNEHTDEIAFTLLLTRDNHSFVPFSVHTELLGDLATLKKSLILRLGMLDIGTVTFHLTDFDADCGAAMPDDVLLLALQHGLVSKLKLEQNFRSPDRIGTFSSTSSDSKSFDASGGKFYPATPQYLLQHSTDKAVDYMNFKDASKPRVSSKDYDLPSLPLVGSLERVPSGSFPINLSLPQLRRLQQNNAVNAKLNKRGLALNTLQPPISAGSAPEFDLLSTRDSLTESTPSSGSSFTIVRKKGREIDFDKRRLNSNESKAPRLIPNIYSSSVTDAAISPISASTIHALEDEKTSSSTGRLRSDTQASRNFSSGLELEKGASFVARRKAPPPPTASNSLKVKERRGTKSFSVLSGSSRSEYYHLSNESIDSFRSSHVGVSSLHGTTKQFDFSDAPSLDLPQHGGGFGDDSDDDDDNDVFFKPLKPKNPILTNENTNHKHLPPKLGSNDLVPDIDTIAMRPSVDEVYDNLEKYFPNTILDKPIIDAYPESPNIVSTDSAVMNLLPKNPPISRTFSNANISPVHPEKESDDQVFYGDGPLLRRRMKTIRVVAYEAHRKRLASQKAVKESVVTRPARKQHAPTGALTRTNTKLWGQKVVEVTSDNIEKGFVGRIRKVANRPYEEFAWVKGELIGRGSFGSVFLALNVTTGEMLAVKQVNVSDSTKSNSDGIDAFHKEVETMKDLDHLNIVQYLGFEQSKKTYSLFLEYVAGGSVSSCLKSYGKFDEPLVKFITRQVLEGLKYLHENGILHRDLKADNLLLEIDGVCKISDFGISKRSQDIYSNNAEMSMQGTVFWMAPEVIHSMVEEKKQGYSAKVDIWSLGCVMLEMFAGQRPWSNEAVVSAIYKLGKTKLAPPIPVDVSKEAKDFLNKCFTIDTEKRPTAAKLLNHEFMRPDSSFHFSQTRLSEIIKSNSTKNMIKRH
ncbi:Pkinase-domain-containing protein [Metschnikowia bicuspidata var. bicuspidata NRRL YB-4993]|uniref:Pkinase-domain-containing protein n=1 Tax=Metschnikowia bicuspidata var. bicuspidata NRRL YB-4993 TaxID=869754 RepID=A0A1A0HIA3_9ASCO|nr:Pkinase-domain-containing protein [Metschnikowia bicuspidata var. bicuspidata NRRL YB-4993]OBA23735.1 Pkinase-domain-containing protein [Metschnikowia bicuspidata var. bicuspidata NRRL YB-4993]